MGALARARRVTRAAAIAGTLAGTVAVARAAPASAPATRVVEMPGCHATEIAAVARVASRVRRDRLYASWTTPDCLSYFVDSCAAKTVDVSIHEKHDARCGGDPATWPTVDRFRVHRRGERIDWFNVVDATWRPFDRIHSEGHR